MENCYYSPVEAVKLKSGADEAKLKYVLRQIFVCTGPWAGIFCYSLSFGSPAIFIAQIRQEAKSDDAISMDMESWLSSVYSYSGVVCTFILAVLARNMGRKYTFLFVGLTSLIGYIIFYFSTTTTHLLISEIIQGPLTASQITVSIMIVSEYSSPRYRGVFLSIKSATFFWGVWVANSIGTFFHWKNIGILAFICSLYYTLTILFWPESPYWLADKKRFEECATSHRWLKGTSKESEAELEKLIQLSVKSKSVPEDSQNNLRKFINIITRRTFYKPISLVLLALTLINFSGKIAFGMYSLDIIKRITNTESTAYKGMLILDGITIIGMYIGCFLIKILKRRTLLLTSSTIAITFLFILSLYLYLISIEIILENTIVSITLLIIYSLTISMGPMIICPGLIGELTPIKHRSVSILLVGCFAQLLMGTILKVLPYVVYYFGTQGLFLFFAVHALLCTVVAYKFLPETKDKTLIQIQQSILGLTPNSKSTECDLLQK